MALDKICFISNMLSWNKKKSKIFYFLWFPLGLLWQRRELVTQTAVTEDGTFGFILQKK